MSEILHPTQNALAIHKRFGWHVFPLVAGGKTPAFEGWQSWAEACSEERILEYAAKNPRANWGVSCGPSNLLVVDVDTKDGAPGEASVLALAQENLTFPRTLKILTPPDAQGNRGYHLYYVGHGVNTASSIAEGIDTRGDGGYVVAPGSYLSDRNGCYEPQDIVDPIAYPAWVSARMAKSSQAPLERPGDDDIHGSIVKGTRDNELTRWAGVLRSQGLGFEEMRSALLAINDVRCQEPLDVDSVERIARSIASKPRGLVKQEVRASKDFEEIKKESEARGNDEPRILDSIPRVSQEERDRDCWIIPNLLVKGHVVGLYGAGGVGKSLMAVQLGLCVAAGIPFCGQQVVAPMPVVYLGCEDEQIETDFRLTQIRDAPEIAIDIATRRNIPFYSWVRDGMDSVIAKPGYGGDLQAGAFLQLLEEKLAALPKGPKLLILDNVSDIFLGDENVRVQVNRFVKYILGDLRLKHDLTIMLLAHPSVAGSASQSSGSTAWTSAVRSRLAFIADEDEIAEHRVLKVMKTNRGSPDFEVPLVWDTWRYKERLKVNSSAPRLKRLADALDRLDYAEEFPIKDIWDQLHGNPAFNDYFVSGETSRAQQDQLRKDFHIGVEGDGTRYEYEHRPKDRARHWCVRRRISDDRVPKPSDVVFK